MNSSISRDPDTAVGALLVDVIGDLEAEADVVVHAVVEEQPVAAERHHVAHLVHAFEHGNQVILEVQLVDRIRRRNVGDVIARRPPTSVTP